MLEYLHPLRRPKRCNSKLWRRPGGVFCVPLVRCIYAHDSMDKYDGATEMASKISLNTRKDRRIIFKEWHLLSRANSSLKYISHSRHNLPQGYTSLIDVKPSGCLKFRLCPDLSGMWLRFRSGIITRGSSVARSCHKPQARRPTMHGNLAATHKEHERV